MAHIPILIAIISFISSTHAFRTVITKENSSVYDTVQRSHLRAKFLSSLVQKQHRSREDWNAKQTLRDVSGEFTMNLQIGTPPQQVKLIFDTGSDLTWTSCSTSNSTGYFDEQSSSTYQALPCSDSACQLNSDYACSDSNTCMYENDYGKGDSGTEGILGTETVSIDSQRFQGILFGCSSISVGFDFDGVEGIVGFGNGPLSFPSQLGALSVNSKFSYCLDFHTSSSPLFIGSEADIQVGDVQTTPLLLSSVVPTFYYVNLTAVYVGDSKFPVQSNTWNGDGTIFDSGTTLTYLPDDVYISVREAFRSQISLQAASVETLDKYGGLQLCYDLSDNEEYEFPELRLEYGGNVEMKPPKHNYLMLVEDPNLYCLALGPRDELGISIIGNVMQQNYQVLFDVPNQILSFAPAKCSDL